MNMWMIVLFCVKQKPEGGEEVAAYFGCSTADLVMIGDRFSTDVVFGNLYGMLTIKTEALDPSKDNMMVRLARWFQYFCWKN